MVHSWCISLLTPSPVLPLVCFLPSSSLGPDISCLCVPGHFLPPSLSPQLSPHKCFSLLPLNLNLSLEFFKLLCVNIHRNFLWTGFSMPEKHAFYGWYFAPPNIARLMQNTVLTKSKFYDEVCKKLVESGWSPLIYPLSDQLTDKLRVFRSVLGVLEQVLWGIKLFGVLCKL